MGTNRHQDFAVLGNALPNLIQWRDAKKLRDAGMKVIRTQTVKRLNNSEFRFSIECEGVILDNDSKVNIKWGMAPILVQSTSKADRIKIIASMNDAGLSRPLDGVLEFESLLNTKREIYSLTELNSRKKISGNKNTFF